MKNHTLSLSLDLIEGLYLLELVRYFAPVFGENFTLMMQWIREDECQHKRR
jgi:hypothetical protein